MTFSVHNDDLLNSRPEVELLLCCARAHDDDEITARIASLIQAGIDWDALLRLTQKHRLIPLVYRSLKAIPSAAAAVPARILDSLQNHFYLSAVHNHRLSDELSHILKLFAEHAIAVIPYKGPALAASLYGDISLRQFSDLDILIRRSDVSKASALLAARSYRQQHQLTRAQEAAFQRIECEQLFSSPEDHLHIDLHWQLVPAYFSLKLDADKFWPRLEESSFEGQRILAFGPEDLLLVLAVHAAKECWERLVWLCDLNELIRSRPALNWPQLIEQSTGAGARRILLLSLKLTSDLLGTKLPEEITRAIEADRAVEILAAQIKGELFREDVRPAGVSRYLLPGQALERRRDRISFRLRLALTPSPEDWAFLRLPDRLLPLYFLVRPLRLARKYLINR
jgi:hypothetical protein